MGGSTGRGTTTKRRLTTRSAARARSTRKQGVRTRSFPCPDDLWHDVEAFARERGLGTPAAAARVLLRSGLSVERRVKQIAAARDWQIEQAWADLQAIAAGDRTFGSWDEIEQAAQRARLRVREREAAKARHDASA